MIGGYHFSSSLPITETEKGICGGKCGRCLHAHAGKGIFVENFKNFYEYGIALRRR